MKLEIDVFSRGSAGSCEIKGCHNKAEFGVYYEKTQFVCNYHIGPCIRRLHKEGKK